MGLVSVAAWGLELQMLLQGRDQPGPYARHSRKLVRLGLMAACAGLSAPAQAEMALDNIDFALDQETADIPGALRMAQASGFEEPRFADAEASSLDPSLSLDTRTRLSFGEHVNSVKWELGAAFAYLTAINVAKMARTGTAPFSFQKEGFFGKDTINLGLDKFAHAHNSYIIAELFAARIRKKTGTTRGTAVTGAAISTGLMIYSELYDGFKATSGVSLEDIAFNGLGAGFSVLRESVPGLDDKLDFRVLIIPNNDIYTFTGREHYRQLRYVFALELAGFERFESSPLRFVELHAGYSASGFTDREIARGDPRRRRPFVGVGVNLSELFFGSSPRTRAARAAAQVLDYWQPPYTYLHAR